jgi:hypothetical protein
MKLSRNLPAKTRIPFKIWVLAGLIAAFSLATQQPASHQSGGTHVIAALDNNFLARAWQVANREDGWIS